MTDGAPIQRSTAEFADAAVEHRFRLETLDEYRARAARVVGLLMIFGVALIGRDILTAPRELLFEIARIRVVLVLIGGGALFTILRTGAYRVVDRILFGCALMLVAGIALTHEFQPNLSSYHYATDVLVLFGVSVAVPNRFWYQAVPAAGMGLVSFLHSFTTPDLPTIVSAGVIMSAAVVIAVTVSHNANVAARHLFRTRERMRTLEGIVPICGRCKSIKESDNRWRRVEDYLTRGPDAVFSHGLCPDCLDASMAEIER